jgi:hypothetical protein
MMLRARVIRLAAVRRPLRCGPWADADCACAYALNPWFAGCRQWTRFQPKRAGIYGGVNACLGPPRGFIAMAMDFAMVTTAERDGELVADLAAERPALREA